jgi:hypothetical protein
MYSAHVQWYASYPLANAATIGQTHWSGSELRRHASRPRRVPFLGVEFAALQLLR